MNQSNRGFGKVAALVVLVVIAALVAWFVFDLGPGGGEFGNQTVTIDSLEKPEWTQPAASQTTGTETDLQAAYQAYLQAYNKLSAIINEGLGDTPEAAAQYEEYQRLKQRYEELEGG